MATINALSQSIASSASAAPSTVGINSLDSFIDTFINIIAGLYYNNTITSSAAGLSGTNLGLETMQISLTDPSSAIRRTASASSSSDFVDEINISNIAQMLSGLLRAVPLPASANIGNTAAGANVSAVV